MSSSWAHIERLSGFPHLHPPWPEWLAIRATSLYTVMLWRHFPSVSVPEACLHTWALRLLQRVAYQQAHSLRRAHRTSCAEAPWRVPSARSLHGCGSLYRRALRLLISQPENPFKL